MDAVSWHASKSDNSWRSGLTIIELLVCLAVIGLLLAIVAPAVQSVRRSANQNRCNANLHQIALGWAEYESMHGVYPVWTDPLVGILPWINPTIPVENGRPTKITSLSTYICPSDSQIWVGGGTSYTLNEGTSPLLGRYDGMLVADFDGVAPINFTDLRQRDIRDGLAQTACFSERLSNQGIGINPDLLRNMWCTTIRHSSASSVERLADECRTITGGQAGGYGTNLLGQSMGHNHLLPPNSPSCSNGPLPAMLQDRFTRVAPPSSLHTGGVNVLFCDGHAQFVGNHIDTKVWRSLGSRDRGEVVELP